MVEVTIYDKKISVPVGTRVIDLMSEEDKHNYLVCQIGAQIKELRYRLSEKNDGMKISFKGLENIEGGKAYEASLRFIIAMAFHNIYPDVRIRFSYNVSRSVFCQALTPGFNMYRAAESIKNEVSRIIAADLPIERVTVSKEEAEEIYRRFDHLDKIDILRYRPESTVNLYVCDGYYDYMHSYMVASTGCIRKYLIEPYSPGIIVQYPRYELDAEIPEFVEETTYGRTLQKAYNWSKKAHLQTIADINRKVEQNSIVDFVQMCEARHSNMLSELGKAIEEDIDNIRLICIAGPSSSGKTTFCNRLRIELLSRGINPVMISMDDYYCNRDEICRIQNTTPDSVDLEHINCLDIERFNKDLFDLINGEEVTLPRFNFKTGRRESGRTIRVEENHPIIIEGIHALNEKLTASIPKHQKYKIYIAPQAQINIDDHSPLNITDLRLIRRIVRDMSFRGSPAAKTIDMWQSVRNGEFKWIYPNQEGANFVFNSALQYELCVLRTKALPALREIKYTDPQFLVANRLIKYLKYFRPIEDESVIPCNSLMREFIGGSCFDV
ncbi:MAG: hypothetical protein SO533_00645 [Eubacteriales bacterium]|nr:nucleoside kinase [Clostridiales bacterium]MDD7594923.1 nucleoside kinase [Clostridiales bacterium]MDY4886142.1 hypothetical protein [Eubacteriales bacterium]MDY5859719.1 hypothetical protein [Eubacteriales bacterium]